MGELLYEAGSLMADDIVTRLRGWVSVPRTTDHMGRITEFHEVSGLRIFEEAADAIEARDAEIERLQKLIHDFYFEEQAYQDAINRDSCDAYVIPQSWKGAYTAFENEALRLEHGDD